jgi:hypothetical protein
MTSTILHHSPKYIDQYSNAGKTACGVTMTTTNWTDDYALVTCKRCLAKLAKDATLTTPDLDAAENIQLPDSPPEVTTGSDEDSWPESPVTMEDVKAAQAHLNKVVKSAKDAIKAGRIATTAKPPKTTKAPTVHLHDADRHPEYQTWCKIPGTHSPDAADVTCKVCRAHIDGKAPLNAIPDAVKAARKSFRSFVARVAYMVYMDEGCKGCHWILRYTNMAGTTYEVRPDTIWVDDKSLGFAPSANIKQWMEDNWSCGEEA